MSGVLKQFKQEGSAWLILDRDDMSDSSSLDGTSSSSYSDSYIDYEQDDFMPLDQARRNPDRDCLVKPLKPTAVRTLDPHPRKLSMDRSKATRGSSGSLSRWDDSLDNSNVSLSNAQWSVKAPLASSNQDLDQRKKRASKIETTGLGKDRSRSNPNMPNEKSSSAPKLGEKSNGSDPIKGFVRRCNASSPNLRQQRRQRRRQAKKGATLDSWLSASPTSKNDVELSTSPIPDLTSPDAKKRPSRVRNLNEEQHKNTPGQTITKLRRGPSSGNLSPKGLKCSSSSLNRLRRSGEIERNHSPNAVGLDEATKSRLRSASLTMIVDSNAAWPAPARTRRLRRATDTSTTNSAPQRSGKLDAPPLRIERRSSVVKKPESPASKEEMIMATTDNAKSTNLFSNFTHDTLLMLLQTDATSVTTPVA